MTLVKYSKKKIIFYSAYIQSKMNPICLLIIESSTNRFKVFLKFANLQGVSYLYSFNKSLKNINQSLTRTQVRLKVFVIFLKF